MESYTKFSQRIKWLLNIFHTGGHLSILNRGLNRCGDTETWEIYGPYKMNVAHA